MEIAPCPVSRRQRQVLVRVASGRTVQEAADDLRIARKTAGRHLEEAYKRLDVCSAAQAIFRLTQEGWLQAPPDGTSGGDGLSGFQRAYLTAFDDFLKCGSDPARTRMRAALLGMSLDAGVTRRAARPIPDPLDRLLIAIASVY